MKKHITLTQLKEIDMKILDEAMNDVEFTRLLNEISCSVSDLAIGKYQILLIKKIDIGAMVYILSLRTNNIHLRQDGRTWKVSAWIGYNNCFEKPNYKEPVDALWEAVKYVLGEED